MLRGTSLGVLDEAVAVGFSTASYFKKSHRDYFGVTPTRDRAAALAREHQERL